MGAFLKFLVIILMIVAVVALVVFCLTNANVGNWVFSAVIGVFLAVTGTVILGVVMKSFGIIVDSNDNNLQGIIDVVLVLVGIAAAIYLTIVIRPYIDFL